MPVIQVTELDGRIVSIEGHVGETLMEALRNGGCDDLQAICGGACSCGSCHVYIAQPGFEALGSRHEGEEMLLGDSDYFQSLSRLSCQVVLTAQLATLQVTIAPPEG